jgi:gliding motility-associated transport system permease protein
MNSRKLAAIVRKELGHYFSSVMGYLVLVCYFALGGFFYYLIMTEVRVASMQAVFQNLSVILLFVTPVITMRLWSEEEKNGTAELLKTSPLTVWEIVLGKYLGVCCFFAVMLLPTFVYLAMIMATGNPDPGPLVANYLGYILSGMAFFSIGLLASTMSENQIVSAIIAFGMLLFLWVVGAAGQNVQGPLGDFLQYLSFFSHTNDFFNGVIDLTHVFYFASVIFLGLFFSVKVLESKRN